MKKKIILLVLSIIIVLMVLTSATYSLFYNKRKLDNTESYKSGVLQIVLQNDEQGLGNELVLNNAIPMSNSDGMLSTPYRFKITNTGNLDYSFDLVLNKSGTINGNYVKVKVEDNDIVTLSSNTVTIATGLTLVAGQSKIIEVRVWLDENTPNSEIGKTLSASLSTTGVGQVYLNASEKIIELAGNCTSWSTGFSGVCATNSYNDNGTTKYHEYRYVGANVNNYVKFNNDLYRIIGVFDSNSTGIDANLVKLISANGLTAATFGVTNASPDYTTYSSHNNDWTTANVNMMLNEYFYNATDFSNTYKSCNDWTYFLISSGVSYKTGDCSNIVGFGLQTNNTRNYIQPATWYIKGFDTNDYTKSDFYNCERGLTTGDVTKDSNCKSGNNGAYNSTITNTNIGLIYPSDYLYASSYYSSSDTTAALNYSYGQQNWLYIGYEWTIMPRQDNTNYGFIIDGNSYIDYKYTYVYVPFNIRPTFYLKANVKIKSGTGSFNDPYTLGF